MRRVLMGSIILTVGLCRLGVARGGELNVELKGDSAGFVSTNNYAAKIERLTVTLFPPPIIDGGTLSGWSKKWTGSSR